MFRCCSFLCRKWVLAYPEATRRKCVPPRALSGTMRMIVVRCSYPLELRTESVSSMTCFGRHAYTLAMLRRAHECSCVCTLRSRAQNMFETARVRVHCAAPWWRELHCAGGWSLCPQEPHTEHLLTASICQCSACVVGCL